MKKLKGFKKGFTLIELIVVIAIIAILAAIALPRLSKYLQDANETKAEANARNAYAAAAAYNATNEISLTDSIHEFKNTELQPYLDSNATIVDKVTTDSDTNEIAVAFYAKGADIPTATTHGDIASGEAAVDTYIVTVYNGSEVVTYGY